jgi:diguanylate cyclase (GGDEF)-like protein
MNGTPLPPALRIDPLLAEFVKPATEAAFREYMRETRIRDTRQAIALSAIFFMVFALTDYLAMYGQGDYMLILFARLGVALYGLVLAHVAGRFWRQLLNGVIPTLVIVGAMLVFISITPLLPFEAGWHGMGMMIMLLGIYTFIPNRFLPALVVALLSSVLFVWVVLESFEVPEDFVATFIALLTVINILGAFAAHRNSRLQREEYRYAAILQDANAQLQREIDERQRLEAELRQRIDRDPLTGVASRNRFFELAPAMLEAAGEARPLSVLLVDVDYFRQINGTYGQLRGDEVLQAIAGVCRQHSRTDDVLARIGGEEFVLLMPGINLAEAAERAERLRAEIQRTPLIMPDSALFFTVSIGVSRALPDDSLNMFLYRVDNALSTAKYKGRNQVACAGSVAE